VSCARRGPAAAPGPLHARSPRLPRTRPPFPRLAQTPGTLVVSSTGLTWRPADGSAPTRLRPANIAHAELGRHPDGATLVVAPSTDADADDGDGDNDSTPPSTLHFSGLRKEDAEAVRAALAAATGRAPGDAGTPCARGGNWGRLALEGPRLSLRVLNAEKGADLDAAQRILSICARDVVGAQVAGAADVALEFAAAGGGDGGGGGRHGPDEDVLTEMTFHVPASCGRDLPPGLAGAGAGAGDDATADADAALAPAARLAAVLSRLSAGADGADGAGGPGGDGARAVASFPDVSCVVPRGRFRVDVAAAGSVRLVGASADFFLRRGAIRRVFVLPKPHAPHVTIALQLDPPLRRGNSRYPFVQLQFPADDTAAVTLDLDDAAFESARAASNDRLERRYEGPAFDVVGRLIRAAAGAKLVRAGGPGGFRAEPSRGEPGGPAVRCGHKAEDGHLYPLDRAFLWAPKPVVLIPYDDVRSVEFSARGANLDGRGAAASAAAARTFDLVVDARSTGETVFRGLDVREWQNLAAFCDAKRIRIVDREAALKGPRGGLLAAPGADDLLGAGAGGSGSDEDEDFDAAAAGGDEPESTESEQDDDDDESGGEGGGGNDARAAAKEARRARAAEAADRRRAKEAKRAAAAAAAAGAADAAGGSDDDDRSTGRPAKKAKKDPAAPKRALSAFFIFSGERRPALRAAEPTLSVPEVGRRLGAEWKAMDDAARAPYQARADADKERYAAEMAVYHAPGGAGEAFAASGGGGGGGAAGRAPKAPRAPKAAKAPPRTAARAALEEERASGVAPARSAFALFGESRRATLLAAGVPPDDVADRVVEAWGGLGTEERETWARAEADDRERHARETAEADRGEAGPAVVDVDMAGGDE